MVVFERVTVALPTKVGAGSRDSDWTVLSTGTIRVDEDTKSITFTPVDGRAKVLGCLVDATNLSDTRHSLSVTTDQTVQNHYRFSFESTHHAQGFLRLVPAVPRPSSGGAGDESTAELERAVAGRLKSRRPSPIVLGGTELYGPDPGGQAGSEVLLGRGALLILDTCDGKTVGTYEMNFYTIDDGPEKIVCRMPIGPKTSLKRSAPDGDPDGPATSFDLTDANVKRVLTFDRAMVGDAFERDFNVRQRLMLMSLKVSKKQSAVDTVRGALAELQDKSVQKRLARLATAVVVLMLLVITAHVFIASRTQPGKPAMELVWIALSDTYNMLSFAKRVTCTAAHWTVTASCGRQ